MKFGELFRKMRLQADRSMGDVARHLAVSVPYISDVERGNRAPFTSDRIHQAASLLGVDPTPLLIAAAEVRGAFELNVDETRPKTKEVGAVLMRGWPCLSDQQLDQIREIVTHKKKKGNDP